MPLPGMAPHQQQQAVSTQQTQLPQNLRIISNFFRTAPDGTVRAFSQPIVHERYCFLYTEYVGLLVYDYDYFLCAAYRAANCCLFITYSLCNA